MSRDGSTIPRYLAGHGGWGGSFVKQACAADDVLVGVQVAFDGTRVDGVRGICAPLYTWTSTDIEFTYGAGAGFLGSSTGTVHSAVCPLHEVLAGWTIGTQW